MLSVNQVMCVNCPGRTTAYRVDSPSSRIVIRSKMLVALGTVITATPPGIRTLLISLKTAAGFSKCSSTSWQMTTRKAQSL